MFMQNFLRLNEGDIVEIIIAFINKNVGNETITEVDYDKLGIHIDSDILIKETPIIINVRCKLNLTEMNKIHSTKQGLQYICSNLEGNL